MSSRAVLQRMPKIARTHAAMRAVLETTELLELILLSLPIRDTIVGTRVCRRWNQCVHSSPAMPQHLFLRPSGMGIRQVFYDRSYHLLDMSLADIISGEPMVAGLWSAPTTSTQVVLDMSSDDADEVLLTPVRLCPLLELCNSHQPTVERLVGGVETEQAKLVTSPGRIGPWTSMLITDPPSVAVTVDVKLRHSEFEQLEINAALTVANADGITIQDLTQQFLESSGCIRCSFPPEWGDDIDLWPEDGVSTWKDSMLEDVVQQVTDSYGGFFECDSVHVTLDGAIVLDAQEQELAERGELQK